MLNLVSLVDWIYMIIQDEQDVLVCDHNAITNEVFT